MTEQTATATGERHVATVFAQTLGHDLLAAILGELRTMPDHWLRMNEEAQQKAIARMRDKVKTMVHETAAILMRGEFPAVAATLDTITIKDGVKVTIGVESSQNGRHALYDAVGKKVLIVLADSERWLNRMDEIKAKADQLQLFDEDYDPSVDQPGYRRDQDAHAPAAPTWADLRKTIDKAADDSVLTQIEAEGAAPIQRMRGDGEFEECQLKDLKRGDVIKVGSHIYTTSTPALKANDGGDYSVQLEETKPLAFGKAAEQQNAEATERGELSGLLEKLWAVHVTLSLGTLQTFTPQQLAVTQEWVEAYAADPENCKIARPFFLPMPDATGDDKKAAEG